jgi:hypothetical protein
LLRLTANPTTYPRVSENRHEREGRKSVQNLLNCRNQGSQEGWIAEEFEEITEEGNESHGEIVVPESFEQIY